MRNVLLWLGFVGLFSAASVKSDYYSDEGYHELLPIFRYLKEKMRAEQVEEEVPERESIAESTSNEMNPPFVYTLPNLQPESDDFQPFAVGPSDSRFYQDFSSSPEVLEGREEEKGNRPLPVSPGTATDRYSPEVSIASDNQDPSHSAIRQIPVTSIYEEEDKADIYFTAIVAGCSAAAVVAVIAIGIGCYRLQKNAKAAADVDYPAYGVTGPNKESSPTSGDRKLAQSAQMYHYQHQKQQIIAMENMGSKERRASISDAESEEENEEGEYTVYECPGLAPTGEMEVKNPLFQDDQTPASMAKPANDSSEESRELPK